MKKNDQVINIEGFAQRKEYNRQKVLFINNVKDYFKDTRFTEKKNKEKTK